jgi:hypothetical protein
VCALARQAAGSGGLASGSGGEAPDPASPRGEGKSIPTRTSTSTNTSTSTSPGDIGCPLRPLVTALHASRTAVVSSPELLQHVFTFLAGGKVEARRDLGRAALVCRLWREAAVGEALWGCVASEVMPAMRHRVLKLGARRCVLERGLCHRDKRACVGGKRDLSSFRLQVEVWDMLDDTCLLSAQGRLFLADDPVLTIEGADRVEVGRAFSAASRDPVQRRFSNIDDYFRRGADTVEEGIRVRVYVRDERAGRQALLWSSTNEEVFRCVGVPPDDPMGDVVPQGSRRVEQANFLPIQNSVSPGQALYARVVFFVSPEAGQEGVAEADKLWRVVGGDQFGAAMFSLQFALLEGEHRETAAEIILLIKGLLEP